MTARRLLHLALATLFLALPVVAQAGTGDFNRVVQALESHYQKKPMGPGFLSFMARCFSPSGVHGLRMAIFEDVGRLRPQGDVDTLIRTMVGAHRQPMVHVNASQRGEQVYVYAQEAGRRFDLMVICAERRDAVVISMQVDADEMQKWMADPGGMAHRRGNSRRHAHGETLGE